MKKLFLVLLPFAVYLNSFLNAQSWGVSFSKKYGQVEVGGPYAGLEFHESRPLPSRVSFYYPVANSIDLSRDYWNRAESRPFVVRIRSDSGLERELGESGWSYTLHPHKVTFTDQDHQFQYRVQYEFGLNQPVFVFSLIIKNITTEAHSVSVSTVLRFIVRTCQTYAWRNSTGILYDSAKTSIIGRFDAVDTDSAVVVVLNAGEDPTGWISPAGWNEAEQKDSRSVAGFEYKLQLAPGDSLAIVQLVGSCRSGEVAERTSRLASSWRADVDGYDLTVRTAAFGANHFHTGDPEIDATARWARAVLSANAHYLDDDIVPMPCPAEYNFFFTHDLLLTDLGAVHYDLPRVREDLLYLVRRAKGGVIPHAYYWRDDKFVTELCAPDNWNHLWFILVSASYLRHSFDRTAGEVFYPFLTRSLDDALTRLGDDHLMYAAHPDWWDIGNRVGPRAYLTVLTVKALREYLFVSAFLGKQTPRLAHLSELSTKMQSALVGRLWDEEKKFLMNENGSEVDEHYYAGSILASAYGMLDHERSSEFLKTTEQELVVPGLGVRTVMPADFHADSLIAYFKFAGQEAGAPFVYINGGIWPQCNAWYIMGLHRVGRTREALAFFRQTMSLTGILRSPMGQPAMYEYRFSDPSSPEFGRIDKPSFLWAGGFTLHVLYRLFAVEESEWNCSIAPRRAGVHDTLSVSYSFGSKRDLRIVGSGERLKTLRASGVLIPSLVLPQSIAGEGPIEAVFGEAQVPYLEGINAILHDIRSKENELHLDISSLDGYRVSASFTSRTPVEGAFLEGKRVKTISRTIDEDGYARTVVTFDGSAAKETLLIHFD